jgi:adenine-specific DNA-methyltransferase
MKTPETRVSCLEPLNLTAVREGSGLGSGHLLTEDFSKQKIVCGNLNLNASYTIAPEVFFVNAPCSMIVPAKKYLLAILNSKLADYFIRSLGITRNGGYFEYKPMFIEQLPVPIIPVEKQEQLATLVEKRAQIQEKISESEAINIEKDINSLVYQLYSLTEEDVNLIELQ